MNKTLNMDTHAHPLDKDGMPDLIWPVAHRELLDLGEQVASALTEALNAKGENDETTIYKLTLKYLIAETCGIFNGDILRERFKKLDTAPQAPKDWAKWPYIFEKKAPPLPPIIESLKARSNKPSLLAKLLNPKRAIGLLKKMQLKPGNMELDGLKLKSLTPEILNNNIICTQRTSLITAHAAQINEDVIFARSHRWFQEISDSEFETAKSQNNEELENTLIDTLKKLYAKWDVPFLAHNDEYYRQYLTEMTASLRVHYKRLQNRDDLPKRLWTGSGGNIWDLMIRHVVISKGGEVTGHDHGGGSGHVDMPPVGFIEFWACTNYMSFNQTQVDEIKAIAPSWTLIDNNIPEIDYVPGCVASEIENQDRFIDSDAKPKKIYLLSTIYDRDRCRSYSLYPDLVYIDWQARFIGKLKEWGYDVYIKPHPESPSLPPKDFEDVLGATIINERFEDVKDDADLVIFDYTYTSVFLAALQTNTPVMIIDFEGMPWYKKAYELAKKRCSIIEGGLDKNNKVEMDWDKLHDGIKKAVTKCNNHEFIKTYYM